MRKNYGIEKYAVEDDPDKHPVLYGDHLLITKKYDKVIKIERRNECHGLIEENIYYHNLSEMEEYLF